LRQCGRDLGNRALWSEFERRFQKRIFLYLFRASRASGQDPDYTREHLLDLAQEVYLRLLQNDGRMMKSFRKDSDLAVRAFLARIATAVVSDHFRYQSAGKRQAQVIPIDEAREAIESWRGADPGAGQVNSLLSWIDVERELAVAEERGRVARDLLIFKLYYIDGFTATELAAFPGFRLTAAGVEAAVTRIRGRLRDSPGRNRPGA
jgi:RNA polymerase sigma-70 factor (ECF subfamily)